MPVLCRTFRFGFCIAVILAAGNVAMSQDKPPAAAAAAPVTYQGLRQLLRTGQSEQEILKLIEQSPLDVGFVLGDGEVAELKKMRVSDEFLDGVQKILQKRATTLASDVTDLVLILDCSGSMSDKMKDGQTKMQAAKQVVGELIQDFPAGRRLGLVVYGHDRSRECQAVDVVRPLSEFDESARQQLKQYVSRLQPSGHTPIARALETASGEIANAKGLSRVVLITDGMELCNGDPVQAAADLVAKSKANVDVIGFVLKPDESKAVDQIAKAGRGKYYDAQTAEKLRQDLRFVAQVAPQVAKAPEKAKEPAKAAPVGKKVRLADRAVRTVKVSKPTIEMPAMKTLAVLPAGAGDNPNVTIGLTAVAQAEKYGQEIRIPPDAKDERFDIYWVPEQGRRVPLHKNVSFDVERSVIEVSPEKCLGLVRVAGKGLPKAEKIYLAEADANRQLVRLFRIQESSKYGETMVVPPGAYDLYVDVAGEKRLELIAQKIEVEAGKVTEVE